MLENQPDASRKPQLPDERDFIRYFSLLQDQRLYFARQSDLRSPRG